MFTQTILETRLHALPLHAATLLRTENVISAAKLAPQSVTDFLRDDEQGQLYRLVEALNLGGIRRRTALAVASVARHEFIADPSHKPFANLNCSIPFSIGSWLTPQYLIALMIERLAPFPNARILEVGSGAGYHLACISGFLEGSARLNGIEINSTYCAFGRAALAKSGYTQGIELLQGDGSLGWPEAGVVFDRIYCTAALLDPLKELPVHQLRSGGLLQCIRGLTLNEYTSYPEASRLRRTFPTFEEYRHDGWKQFSCLSTSRQESDGLVEFDRLFDVRFVPLYHNSHEATPINEDPFRELRGLL